MSSKRWSAHSLETMLAPTVGLLRMSTEVSLMVQGMVRGEELIRRTSGDNSSSLDHSLLLMAVRFSTFSLWMAVSIGSMGATGTGGFLL